MNEYYDPHFIGGPLDGGRVSMAYWILDEVQYVMHDAEGNNMLFLYQLDESDKNYHYFNPAKEHND